MSSVLFELKPDRELLDSKFDGYKLSLEEIPTFQKKLPKPVNVVLLRSDQISYMHTKLFGLHNHLVGDKFDKNVSIYYVDEDFNLCKIYYDPNLNEIVGPIQVFSIPKRSTAGEIYNVTFQFVTENLAVLSDGSGMLYVLNTGDRENDCIFTVWYADLVLGDNIGYVICDAVYKQVENKDDELHVLLLNIKKNEAYEKVSNIVHWISISKKDNNWGQTSLRQLTGKGDVQYIHLEKNCEALYTIGEFEFQFTLNSEFPIVKEKTGDSIKKTHTWSQNIDEINIKLPLPENFEKELIKVSTEPTEIEVKYQDEILLSGDFYQRIDYDLTGWETKDQNIEICLYKHEPGIMWPELVLGDQTGEYILDTCIIEEVNERLQNLTSDTMANPPAGTTFNSQQIEECDFASDTISLTFQRLSGRTNKTTHKCYLGVHQIVLTADLNTDLPPAIGLRHDVDVCLWQPRDSENIVLKHEGSLLAFGYVQASKSNRKFCACSPDLNYSCVSEFSRHLFIYRQNKSVVSTELRNRVTGRRVSSIAQQQVVNIPDEEVIGVYATNKLLFLLGKSYLLALKM